MRVLTLVLLILAAPSWSVEPQPQVGLGSTVSSADLLYFAGSPERSYTLLEGHIKENPSDYEALWRAARAAVVIGIDTEGIEPQNRWLDPAIDLSNRAVIESSDQIEGRYWRGAAAGRRALNAGNTYAAELAQQVYDDAHFILAQDSLHGGAHNLLGKLNYEIMSLSRIERFIGRLVVRNQALRDSSWENAEYHLGAAAELWPDFVLFRYDLAQLHLKRGRAGEAQKVFEELLNIPTLHPVDRSLKERARMYVRESNES